MSDDPPRQHGGPRQAGPGKRMGRPRKAEKQQGVFVWVPVQSADEATFIRDVLRPAERRWRLLHGVTPPDPDDAPIII